MARRSSHRLSLLPDTNKTDVSKSGAFATWKEAAHLLIRDHESEMRRARRRLSSLRSAELTEYGIRDTES